MADETLTHIGDSLREKRARLRSWAESATPDALQEALGPEGQAPFERHLEVLESAIEQAEQHTLGLCTECHEPVESGLIQVDYTCCVCLEHLSEAERRQLETELELAGAVQRSLLPRRPPDFPQLEIAAFSRPAQIVSGDYFDFLAFPGGRLGVLVADVAGHGVSSSLIMASLQAMLRTLAQEHESPSELVARVNGLCLHNIQFTTFITLFLGVYDPSSRRLTYCNAGHNPPIFLPRGGETSWLGPTGAAIGLTEASDFGEETIEVSPGDLVMMYTDGVTETANPEGLLLGAERLASWVREHEQLPVQDQLEAIRRRLDGYAGGAEPADDITLVLFRVRG